MHLWISKCVCIEVTTLKRSHQHFIEMLSTCENVLNANIWMFQHIHNVEFSDSFYSLSLSLSMVKTQFYVQPQAAPTSLYAPFFVLIFFRFCCLIFIMHVFFLIKWIYHCQTKDDKTKRWNKKRRRERVLYVIKYFKANRHWLWFLALALPLPLSKSMYLAWSHLDY